MIVAAIPSTKRLGYGVGRGIRLVNQQPSELLKLIEDHQIWPHIPQNRDGKGGAKTAHQPRWAFPFGEHGKSPGIHFRQFQVLIAGERIEKMVLEFSDALYLFVLLKSPVPTGLAGLVAFPFCRKLIV